VNLILRVRRTSARRASPPGTREPHAHQPDSQEPRQEPGLVSWTGRDGLAGRFTRRVAAGASVAAGQNSACPATRT